MVKRENEILESYKSLQQRKAQRASVTEAAENKIINDKKDFVKNYYKVTESRERREHEHGKLLQEARDNAFSTALKAIYISSLEAASLTDQGIILAENMVDNYIKESGGAQKIFNNVKTDTYLLAKLRRIVEDNAEANVKEIENINPDMEIEDNTDVEDNKNQAADVEDIVDALSKAGLKVVKKDDSSTEIIDDKLDVDIEKDKEDNIDDDLDGNGKEKKKHHKHHTKKKSSSKEKDIDDDLDPKEEDSDTIKVNDKPAEDDKETDKEINDIMTGKDEESSNQKDEAEKPSDNNSDEKDEEIDLEKIKSEDDEEESEDDEAIDIDGDGEPDIGDIDDPEPTVNSDPNKKMFEELEDEKEVKKAVELIRTRVADAEEAFIKRNAEDKKKIDELLGKISNNISTVNKIADNDSDKAKVAQEAVVLCKQKINELNEQKSMTIFEKMTRKLTESILKDQNKREKFIDESTGYLDTGMITEASKVMYAFLETLNTLQLESVDGSYIKNIIDNMN